MVGKVRTDGIIPAFQAVRAKLGQPLPLGYCNVGEVLEVGGDRPEAEEIRIGERVVSNGSHAEVVSVPCNLCAKVPDGVSDEEAALTVVGAIGLQGIRLAQSNLGETSSDMDLVPIGEA